ncbi:MAG: hypothetical protein IT378_15790 [Sandaracinaceae bacterium]|nr:hypothetical protein [Sandaracinaceae bacterium]
MIGERRIRRLTLVAGERRGAARAAALIEDAFRTASLPILRPGSVLVVRKLDLGVVSTERPSQTVALRITERVRALSASALRFDHPRAEAAAAVVFADAPSARAALAIRLAIGPPPREWFWPAAIAGWKPGTPLERALPALLAPPRAAPSLPASLFAARFVASLVQARAAEPVLAVLPAEAAFVRVRAASARTSEPRVEGVPLPRPFVEILRWAIARFPRDDPRTPWIARAAVLALRPELASTSLEAPAALATLAEVRRRVIVPVPAEHPAGSAARARARERPAPAGSALRHEVALEDPRPAERDREALAPSPLAEAAPEREAHAVLEPVAGERPLEAGPAATAPARPTAKRDPHWREPAGAGWPAAPPFERVMATELAGLFFALPLLLRLGLERELAREPSLHACAFGWRVLVEAAARAGAGGHDPILTALAPAATPEPLASTPFVAPLPWWRELFVRDELTLHLAPEGCAPSMGFLRGTQDDLWMAFGDPLEEPLASLSAGRVTARAPAPAEPVLCRCRGWASALARLCEDRVGLDLAALLRRPGWVAASPTHVDLLAPASSVDLRVRRQALDADPGWVPWLGRILALHYVDDDELSRLVARSG